MLAMAAFAAIVAIVSTVWSAQDNVYPVGSRQCKNYTAQELLYTKCEINRVKTQCAESQSVLQSRIDDLEASLETAISNIDRLTREQSRQAGRINTLQSGQAQQQTALTNDLQTLENTLDAQLCLFMIPWGGGHGGESFSEYNAFMNSGKARITKFTIRHGKEIDCFGLTYGSTNGGCHGGTGGTRSDIRFDHDEYIVALNGAETHVVRQITVVTNKRRYGPYGRSGGSSKYFDFEGKRLAFISGNSDKRLDGINLHFYC